MKTQAFDMTARHARLTIFLIALFFLLVIAATGEVAASSTVSRGTHIGLWAPTLLGAGMILSDWRPLL